jgi:hypothetical protein
MNVVISIEEERRTNDSEPRGVGRRQAWVHVVEHVGTCKRTVTHPRLETMREIAGGKK